MKRPKLPSCTTCGSDLLACLCGHQRYRKRTRMNLWYQRMELWKEASNVHPMLRVTGVTGSLRRNKGAKQ
jgi:hypothetical protein